MAPRQAAKRDTENETALALLDAAYAIIIRKDSLDVTFAEIAAESGINSSLITYYYGDKEGLLFSLFQRIVQRNLEDRQKQLAALPSARDRMRVHLIALIDSCRDMPHGVDLAFSILKKQGRWASEMTEMFKRSIDTFSATLAEGVRSNEFRAVDPMVFYLVVLGACSQLYQSRELMRRAFGLVAITDEIRDVHAEIVTSSLLNYLLIEGEGAGPTAPAHSKRG